MNKLVFGLMVLCSSYLQAQHLYLYPMEIKGKWGYMNQNGEMAIAPQYDYADDFYNGYAVVALNNMPCVINIKNERIIDTGLYQTIGVFSEGMSSVKDFSNHKFYVNAKGEKIIILSDSIYEARLFKNGLAVVAYQYDKHETKFEVDISTIAFKFGYINRSGQPVTGFIYDDADDMYDGLARFKKGDAFGVIDSTGKEIIPARYGLLGRFYESKATVGVNGKFGYINSSGDMIIKPAYDLAFDFNEGLAGIWVKGKHGYINEKGIVVIKPIYEQIRAFSQGFAAVYKDGKWGFINTKGEVVIPFNFDNASAFSEGLCAVLVKRKWGFINKEGRLAIPADFEAVGSFENGIADAVYRDVSLYLNQRGNVLPMLGK